jgi:cysteine synthase B
VQLFAKAEWFNPGGSVKDRPALRIMQAALDEGQFSAGKRLLDSTSGNMGISYATFGAALDIPITLVIPGNASPERMVILQALGAEVILSDPLEGSDGAIREARRLSAEYPDRYFYANQYNNPANWRAHYLTTGPEIVQQTEGAITHFVAGLGTTGTLTGVGRYLRQKNPAVNGPVSRMHPSGLEGFPPIPFNPAYSTRPCRTRPCEYRPKLLTRWSCGWRGRKAYLWVFLPGLLP